jgi:hypothetical protein
VRQRACLLGRAFRGSLQRTAKEAQQDLEISLRLLKAYDKWDTVMLPLNGADGEYFSFEKIALPVAAWGR